MGNSRFELDVGVRSKDRQLRVDGVAVPNVVRVQLDMLGGALHHLIVHQTLLPGQVSGEAEIEIRQRIVGEADQAERRRAAEVLRGLADQIEAGGLDVQSLGVEGLTGTVDGLEVPTGGQCWTLTTYPPARSEAERAARLDFQCARRFNQAEAQAYPIAALAAYLGNLMGGKPDDAQALPEHQRYTPTDFLPTFTAPATASVFEHAVQQWADSSVAHNKAIAAHTEVVSSQELSHDPEQP